MKLSIPIIGRTRSLSTGTAPSRFLSHPCSHAALLKVVSATQRTQKAQGPDANQRAQDEGALSV